jgi:ribonuclease HI
MVTKNLFLPNSTFVFTDGSVNNHTKVGYGAYLITSDLELPLPVLKEKVGIKIFEGTSSTRLELQILLWALGQLDHKGDRCCVFTDSQNIIQLPNRRNRLEQAHYISKNNRLMANHDLYKEFFALTDQMPVSFTKVHGHMPSSLKGPVETIFSLVDKASRLALRKSKG